MNKIILVLLLLVTFSLNLVGANSFDGKWKGNGEQIGSKWTIKINIDNDIKKYTIDYPSLNCGRTLTLLSETNKKIEFRELLTNKGYENVKS